MRVLGWLRTALTWAVGVPLLAVALGGPLLWLWLRAGDNQAYALALAVLPVTAVLGTTGSARRLVLLSQAEPAEASPAVVEAFARQGMAAGTALPLLLTCPNLAVGEALVVRGLRRRYAYLPPAVDGTPDPAAVPAAVRQLRLGTACVVPLYLSVCGWQRSWVDGTRFACASLTRRPMSAYTRVVLLPLLLLALWTAPMAAIAYLGALLLTPVVGPGTARRVSRVLGTQDGRPRQVQERSTDVGLAKYWGSSIAFRSATSQLRDVDPVPDSRPVGVLGLPRAVAAGTAPTASIAALPGALMIVLVAYFAALYPAQRLVWPGEHAVTAQVVRASYSSDGAPGTGYLSVRVGGRPIPQLDTSRTLVAGHDLRLVARTAHGRTTYRDPMQKSTAAILVTLAFVLLLALLATVVGPRAMLGSPDPPAWRARGAALGRPAQRRPGVAGLARVWPLWVGVLVLSSVGGWMLGGVAGLVGRLAGAADAYRSAGTWTGFVVTLALLGFLLVRSVAVRGDPLRLVAASRAATGTAGAENDSVAAVAPERALGGQQNQEPATRRS